MMIKITDGFQLSASVDLSVLDRIPIMDHPYGDSQPSNDVFRWMTYYNANGEIGFARNLGTFMPEVAECVVSFLSRCMEGSFDPHRVNFMRTRGSSKMLTQMKVDADAASTLEYATVTQQSPEQATTTDMKRSLPVTQTM